MVLSLSGIGVVVVIAKIFITACNAGYLTGMHFAIAPQCHSGKKALTWFASENSLAVSGKRCYSDMHRKCMATIISYGISGMDYG